MNIITRQLTFLFVTILGVFASSDMSAQLCSGTTLLTSESASFSDGSGTSDYANNANCMWHIQAPAGTVQIRLDFGETHTESGFDSIIVYDGGSISDKKLLKFSGDTTSMSLYSSGAELLVRFVSNSTITAAGFDATYYAMYCKSVDTLTAASGTFSDGSQTNDYAEQTYCSWSIQPAGATSVTLDFSSFTLEDQAFIDVYDGSDGSASYLTYYDKYNPPSGPITSSTGALYIAFTSYGSPVASGWTANYTSTTTPLQQYCDQTTILTAESGTFDDASGNSNYRNNSHCEWLIAPEYASKIVFTLDQCELDYTHMDTITVYDGESTSDPILYQYTGTGFSLPNLYSSGNKLLVVFKSDGLNVNKGFSAHYSTVYCSGQTTLTDPSGTFSDGSNPENDYKNDNNCSWLIQPAGALAVRLDFKQFRTEEGYDYVKVYDGTNNGAPLLGSYSGSMLPPSLTSTGPSMFLEFNSDNSVVDSGWVADYQGLSSYCSAENTYTEPNGSFTDGSGANNYLNNTDCTFLIAPEGTVQLKLSFTQFSTELNKDSVFVYDGSDAARPLLGAFSGNTIPPVLYTTGGTAFIRFKSNPSVRAQGWTLNYTTEAYFDETYCSQQAGVLTAKEGTFTDGSGNDRYKNYSNCEWLIQPNSPNVSFITLNFSDFNTEKDKDIVRVYDGNNDGERLIASFSGSNIPTSIKSTGPEMLVKFTSNATNVADGWTANYKSDTSGVAFCNSLSKLTSASGSFDDGSGTNKYTNRSACKWLIKPSDAIGVKLSFPKVKTEKGYDFITVYDGETDAAPVLATLSGDTSLANVQSTGGAVFVKFTSDQAVTDSGWNATYTAVVAQSTDYCTGLTVLTTKDGSVTDGSGPKNYANGSNCKWLIKPANAKNITLNFVKFDTQTDRDYVYVYDGETESDKLLGVFSGANLPGDIHSSKGKVLIKFSTDASSTAAGWEINYTSEISSTVSYCSGTTTLSQRQGSFSDGSNTEEYQPDASCKWLINPAGVSRIKLYFDAFETEGGFDFVKVYKGSVADAAKLLGSFSGNAIPSMVETTEPSMLVVFTSDESGNKAGWAAHYTTDSVGGSTYCIPAANTGTARGDYIDGVILKDIYAVGTGSTDGSFYNDYTSLSTTLSSGARYVLEVTAGQRVGDRYAAWIDYNNNKVFDSNERIAYASSKVSGEVLKLGFYVSDALSDTGLKRMRVMCSSSDINAACDPVTYGEVEDYTVSIVKCAPEEIVLQSITGKAELCSGAEGEYTTPLVQGANKYIWSITPSSWTITKQNSNPKENVKVTAKAGTGTGKLCVVASDKCKSSVPQCVDIAIKPLPVPVTAIEAQDSACSSETVLFRAVDGNKRPFYKYAWTFPSGTAVIGSTTDSIIEAKMGLASDDVSVAAMNECGKSTLVKKAIQVIVKPNAPQWEKRDVNPCTRDSAIYSVKFNKDIIYYSWSVPDQWLILDGQGKRELLAFTGDLGGVVQVEASNRCFASSPLKTDATMKQCVTGITDQSISANLLVYPNPNQGFFTIDLQGLPADKLELRVLNVLGQAVWKEQLNGQSATTIPVVITDAPEGVYLLEVRTENGSKFHRFVVEGNR